MKWHTHIMVELIIVFCLIIQGVESKLIFSTTSKIKEINLENGEVSDILTDVESNVHSMDYDYTNGYIYFSRNDKNDISRFRYPSDQPYNYEIVILADRPIGVAVDPFCNHVYWTERYTGNLYRCDVDGSNKEFILQDGQLYALALDHLNRWLYYSTYDINNRSIRRSRLDGNETRTIFNVHPERVTGLSIGSNDREILYWMEHDKGNLKSRNVDGTNEKIYRTNTASANVGIHVYDSKIYCSNDRRILMVTLRPATTVNVLYTDTGRVLSVLYHDDKSWLEVWLGANALNVEIQFIWNTSSDDFDFTDCGPREPNGLYYEHCLSTHMYRDGKLHWNDGACSTMHLSVCAKRVEFLFRKNIEKIPLDHVVVSIGEQMLILNSYARINVTGKYYTHTYLKYVDKLPDRVKALYTEAKYYKIRRRMSDQIIS
ncbi:VLDLR [Mytilus coruscus]|uniref:VLDLR n=1 Tax=Mytilus coruscus TaxID=42192 RepID=A0A6J8DJ70_MYTCO|nr:VLDLR [Mytilus coruscus]